MSQTNQGICASWLGRLHLEKIYTLPAWVSSSEFLTIWGEMLPIHHVHLTQFFLSFVFEVLNWSIK